MIRTRLIQVGLAAFILAGSWGSSRELKHHNDPKWNVYGARDVAEYIYHHGTQDGKDRDCTYKFENGLAITGDIGSQSGKVTVVCNESWEIKRYDKSDPPTHINRHTSTRRYDYLFYAGAVSGIRVEEVAKDLYGNEVKP